MKAHAIELRERVVRFVKQGGSKVETAKRFDVGRQTVYRYIRAEQAGRLAPKPWGGSRKRFPSERLEREVAEHGDFTLAEYAEALGVSHVAVWKRLRQLAVTRKKTPEVRRAGRARPLVLPARA